MKYKYSGDCGSAVARSNRIFIHGACKAGMSVKRDDLLLLLYRDFAQKSISESNDLQ